MTSQNKISLSYSTGLKMCDTESDEIQKAKSFEESFVQQTMDFLQHQGKNEMALLLKELFDAYENIYHEWNQHRVLGPHLTYPQKSPPLGHAFFDAKQHGEQRLLKSFCSEWVELYTVFEKKLFSY